MNKGVIEDLDFVQPGTKIRLPDNRKPQLASAAGGGMPTIL